MRKYWLLLAMLLSFCVQNTACVIPLDAVNAAVTYSFSGGRLGDNILSYVHALWVSYKYDIPLLYRPFRYSEQLALHDPQKDRDTLIEKYTNTIQCGLTRNVKIERSAKVLYTVPFYSEFNQEKIPPYLKVDWDNKRFKDLMKRRLKSSTPIKQFIPKDRITVAIHVRKGGGFDINGQNFMPYKFPPDSFYIKSLKTISEMLRDQPIYAFIFTDDAHPEHIAQEYARRVNLPNITYDYRKAGNHYAANVLEDLFAMSKFNCLIRPLSNYSLIASKLGSMMIEIAPAYNGIRHGAPFAGKLTIIDKRAQRS